METDHTVGEVRTTARILRRHSTGLDYEAADMLNAYADMLDRQAAGVTDGAAKYKRICDAFDGMKRSTSEQFLECLGVETNDVCKPLDELLSAALSTAQPVAAEPVAQATTCAVCGKHKNTPLRIDAMGGYVCLTCIDEKLSSLLGEFGYPEAQPTERQGESFPMTEQQVRQWIDACNHEPARQVLRDYLRMRTHPAAPEGVPAVCDGKEQDAFEAWAKGKGYDMACHPLHWLFLNERTYAARQGWAGAIEYVTQQLAAAPSPSQEPQS